MSMFDLKGGSSGNGWNYHDNTKTDYMEMLEGTVVEISNPQARDFNTGQPKTWPDGNPVRNLQMIVRMRDGRELAWTFSPKSAASNACLAALDPNDSRPAVSIEELLGKFVRVQTQGGVYNRQHPRPWWVTVLGDGEANMVRGLKDLSLAEPTRSMPGMPAPQPAPVQQTPPPPVPQQQAPAPTAFQQAQAAAQQAVAGQSFQQVPAAPQVGDPTGGVYDEDIPF